MSELFSHLAVFCFGICGGLVLMTHQACRPQGYKANNGKWYRIVEVAHNPQDTTRPEADHG